MSGATPLRDPPAGLRERLRAELRLAVEARRQDTVVTLRSMLAALDNAEAVEAQFGVPDAPGGNRGADALRRVLTPDEMRRVLRAEAEERSAAAARHERLGRRDEARRLREEVNVISRFL